MTSARELGISEDDYQHAVQLEKIYGFANKANRCNRCSFSPVTHINTCTSSFVCASCAAGDSSCKRIGDDKLKPSEFEKLERKYGSLQNHRSERTRATSRPRSNSVRVSRSASDRVRRPRKPLRKQSYSESDDSSSSDIDNGSDRRHQTHNRRARRGHKVRSQCNEYTDAFDRAPAGFGEFSNQLQQMRTTNPRSTGHSGATPVMPGIAGMAGLAYGVNVHGYPGGVHNQYQNQKISPYLAGNNQCSQPPVRYVPPASWQSSRHGATGYHTSATAPYRVCNAFEAAPNPSPFFRSAQHPLNPMHHLSQQQCGMNPSPPDSMSNPFAAVSGSHRHFTSTPTFPQPPQQQYPNHTMQHMSSGLEQRPQYGLQMGGWMMSGGHQPRNPFGGLVGNASEPRNSVYFDPLINALPPGPAGAYSYPQNGHAVAQSRFIPPQNRPTTGNAPYPQFPSRPQLHQSMANCGGNVYGGGSGPTRALQLQSGFPYSAMAPLSLPLDAEGQNDPLTPRLSEPPGAAISPFGATGSQSGHHALQANKVPAEDSWWAS